MGLFKRKETFTRTDAVKASAEQLRANEKMIGVLEEIVSSEEELCEKLKEIANIIRYSSPSENADILEMDKKIANKLECLKMMFIKADAGNDYSALPAEIKGLKIMMMERNSKKS